MEGRRPRDGVVDGASPALHAAQNALRRLWDPTRVRVVRRGPRTGDEEAARTAAARKARQPSRAADECAQGQVRRLQGNVGIARECWTQRQTHASRVKIKHARRRRRKRRRQAKRACQGGGLNPDQDRRRVESSSRRPNEGKRELVHSECAQQDVGTHSQRAVERGQVVVDATQRLYKKTRTSER